jgi:YD repeat-containing protein
VTVPIYFSTISDTGVTLATYDYMGVGRVEKLTLGNDTWSTRGYDDLMRSTTLAHQGTLAGDIDLRAFAWDDVHNRTRRSETRAGGLGRAYDYGYDSLSRLTSSTRTAASADTLSQV